MLRKGQEDSGTVRARVDDTCAEAYLEEEGVEPLFREGDEAVAPGAEEAPPRLRRRYRPRPELLRLGLRRERPRACLC